MEFVNLTGRDMDGLPSMGEAIWVGNGQIDIKSASGDIDFNPKKHYIVNDNVANKMTFVSSFVSLSDYLKLTAKGRQNFVDRYSNWKTENSTPTFDDLIAQWGKLADTDLSFLYHDIDKAWTEMCKDFLLKYGQTLNPTRQREAGKQLSLRSSTEDLVLMLTDISFRDKRFEEVYRSVIGKQNG